MRQRVPTGAHLEQSDCRIAPELSKHDADRSLAGLIVSDQMQRQPALNAGCAAMDVMVPSQGTNATGSRVLVVDHSLAGWTAPREVHENNPGKVGGSKCCAFGIIRSRDCTRIE